ncbi:protein SPEAR2 isoform X4 [Brassica rapa]|uniref:protein SPEAR2 isoform X4 n=1 Tax=Brassica campestris TaxID=3711 RepID=UPI0004F1D362|nr:protein SPEAR2 isoform X4 [Brassica rapa]
MCSNISSGSYGGDRDFLQRDDYFGSCPKKQKKDKVRRRGPGVAELEKIRLEEENKTPSLVTPHSSSSLSLPRTDHTLFFPPPPPPQLPLPSSYTTNHIFRWSPATAMPPNFDLPLSSYLSNGSFPMDMIPPVPFLHRKQHYPNHQTMNLANPSPGPGRLYQFIEPPSNQRSCVDNVSQILQEEEKVVMSAKRPWHFLADTTTKASVGPISRELKHNRSLDMRLISPVQDSGTTICNPISIDSPTSITRDFNVQYEQQQPEQDFDENLQWRSKKTFYSFIPSNDQSNIGQEYRACEPHESAADHGIDLSLKL